MAMTGSSTTSAPSPPSRSTSSDAWERARVTTTRRPASGAGSSAQSGSGGLGRTEVEPGHRADHDDRGGRQVDRGQLARVDGPPAGGRWSPSAPRPPGCRRGGRRPSARSAIRARSDMPIRTTSVPPARPRASQSTARVATSPPRRGRSPRSPRWPAPVGHRDAGRGRSGEGRADPGHHLVARPRPAGGPRPPRRPGRTRRGLRP